MAALDLVLTDEEVRRIEAPYTPRHDFQGVSDPKVIKAISARDLVGERLIEPRFDLTYHRKRFLEELEQTKPPVFVDVTGIRNSFYYRPELYGYETFPELKRYLEQNYRYMGEIPDGFGRLFVSRQRLKELEPLRSRETN